MVSQNAPAHVGGIHLPFTLLRVSGGRRVRGTGIHGLVGVRGCMMLQVIKQTREERMTMYLKLTKRELAEMLINANEALSRTLPVVSVDRAMTPSLPPVTTWHNGAENHHSYRLYK